MLPFYKGRSNRSSIVTSVPGFFLVHEGRRYDSKAIVGVAFGYQFPDRGPLKSSQFSGGQRTVERVLVDLGFMVEGSRRSVHAQERL